MLFGHCYLQFVIRNSQFVISILNLKSQIRNLKSEISHHLFFFSLLPPLFRKINRKGVKSNENAFLI